MGSSDSRDPDELNVLITGFGPFREEYPVNPAWEITRLLPDYLPPAPGKATLQQRRPSEDVPTLPPVRIHKYPKPVRVNYRTVRELVPTLWDDDDDGRRPIDLMVHIGMASPRRYHSIERRAHRDGYRGLDVDGEPLADDERRVREGDKWIWYGMPPEIETDLLLDDVLDRWKGYVPWDADVRISEDAGRYLCEFTYYSSLAHLHRRGEHRRVVFLHVPVDVSPEALRRGVDLTVQLVRAALESERSPLCADRRALRARQRAEADDRRRLRDHQQRVQWQQDQELRERRQREQQQQQQQQQQQDAAAGGHTKDK